MIDTVSSTQHVNEIASTIEVYSWADADVSIVGAEVTGDWRTFWAVWVR